jgi:hypothetical protein
MTKKRMNVLGWAALGCLIALSAGCKGNNPVTPPKDPLELLYPKGGESLKVGDTVTIRWQINDSTKVSSVKAKLSTNNGITYDVWITGSGSIFPPQMYVPWTITVGQVSNQCKIMIGDYLDNSITDMSGTFTVHN